MKLPAFFDLSWARVLAVFLKELVQMRRDRPTFGIMIAMPVMQLILFGYAINNDPRHLPAVIEMREDGPLTRDFLASLRAEANEWSVTRGARSGRVAWQFIQDLAGRLGYKMDL